VKEFSPEYLRAREEALAKWVALNPDIHSTLVSLFLMGYDARMKDKNV
jgi:hypothetical protein